MFYCSVAGSGYISEFSQWHGQAIGGEKAPTSDKL